MRFYGKEKQDRFAYYLIGEKGIFLDIGCYHPTHWNNTKALEEAGWKGLMFDIREGWVELCKQHRTSKVFHVDVATDRFSEILKEVGGVHSTQLQNVCPKRCIQVDKFRLLCIV